MALSADDWDAQMMFFLGHGYRVIAHDRRGHGRSDQVTGGHDMDHYADDLAALTAHLDLHDAVHIGHSAGGGEAARYIGRHGESRVAKAVLISAVTPYVMAGEGRPDGLPKSVFDDFRTQLATHRSEFFNIVASGPFYGFNRPGAEPSAPVIPDRAPMAVGLVKNGTLKTYPGYPHGMPVTHADVLNPDLLAFIQS